MEKVERNIGQEELSRLTGMSKQTIANWAKKGCPHDVVPIGLMTVRRYNLSEVNAWAKAQRK